MCVQDGIEIGLWKWIVGGIYLEKGFISRARLAYPGNRPSDRGRAIHKRQPHTVLGQQPFWNLFPLKDGMAVLGPVNKSTLPYLAPRNFTNG